VAVHGKKMKILIDYREPARNVKYLQDLKCETEVRTLDIGDYIFVNDKEEAIAIFERKEFGDWVSSIKNNHLTKQLMQMEQFNNSFLILIGDLNTFLRFNKFSKWSAEQQAGSLGSVCARYKTKIIPVMNNKQAMETMVKTCEKLTDEKTTNIYQTELLRSHITTDDIYLKMLCCVDGLGIKKAQDILKKWQFFELKNITTEQLKEVDGIGDKIALKIKEIFK
jgi:ERCC4-type nuclease